MLEPIKILERLVNYPECEFIEYKENFHSAEEIGERISAIANSASLHNKPYGYLVFGVKDSTRDIVGTTFCAKSEKKGNEILELWLVNRLNPKIDFEIIEFDYKEGVHISMYKIPAASGCPVNFINRAYILSLIHI